MRGEDWPWPMAQAAARGLPPRARGRPVHARGLGPGRGTTPACAGKTAVGELLRAVEGDYPRVRGEDDDRPGLWETRLGLPPRARGRPDVLGTDFPTMGTTPACAGKTSGVCPGRACRRDYPRVRGEDISALAITAGQVGLPPRARGRRLQDGTGNTGRRTTPACAGKTGVLYDWECVEVDYPRVRGEDIKAIPPRWGGLGLPPRARGRPLGPTPCRMCVGTTPACAGKTFWANGPEIPERDYPRVRGEDACAHVRTNYQMGLPPRARGRPR